MSVGQGELSREGSVPCGRASCWWVFVGSLENRVAQPIRCPPGSSPGMNGLVGDGVILADLEGLDVIHCKSSQ